MNFYVYRKFSKIVLKFGGSDAKYYANLFFCLLLKILSETVINGFKELNCENLLIIKKKETNLQYHHQISWLISLRKKKNSNKLLIINLYLNKTTTTKKNKIIETLK